MDQEEGACANTTYWGWGSVIYVCMQFKSMVINAEGCCFANSSKSDLYRFPGVQTGERCSLCPLRPKKNKTLQVGWVGLGWVGLGWVGLGWVGLGWVGAAGGLGWGGWACTSSKPEIVGHPMVLFPPPKPLSSYTLCWACLGHTSFLYVPLFLSHRWGHPFPWVVSRFRGPQRHQLPPLPLAQALPCLSTRARLTVVFPTALLGFLLWALPCLSTETRLPVVFLTFSVLAQGVGGVCR